MKKTKNFILRQLADEYILIPTGNTVENFNGIITLSDSALFIYQNIENVNSFEELINLMKKEYKNIDEKTLINDTVEFIFDLIQRHIIEPSDKKKEW